jgi:hypothetical protein
MNIEKHDPTFTFMLLLGVALASVTAVLAAGNIDSTDKWAWGTNVGWINFDPTHGGVSVYSDHLEGYAWGENIGWIRLGTCTGGGPCTYANTSATNYGVNNDGGGNLSGYAWSTDTGWINFDPEGDERVTIDPLTGDFDGYAWGENIGWIHFQNADPAYKVNTAWRASSPVADAGPDQVIAALSPVTLDGSASTGPGGQLPLTYGWTQSGGPAVTLSSAGVVSPTFTAPGAAAVLTFTLVVTDSTGLSDPTPDTVVVTVTDAPGVIVDPTSLTVSEPDDIATFTLRLTGEPTAAVTFTLASSDPGECSVPASAVVPPIEWQTGVTVTVSAVDDAIEDNSQPCTIYTTAASSDPRYAGIVVDDVDVTVTDDESFVYVYLPVIFRTAP